MQQTVYTTNPKYHNSENQLSFHSAFTLNTEGLFYIALLKPILQLLLTCKNTSHQSTRILNQGMHT